MCQKNKKIFNWVLTCFNMYDIIHSKQNKSKDNQNHKTNGFAEKGENERSKVGLA